jgi:hypothetical protein
MAYFSQQEGPAKNHMRASTCKSSSEFHFVFVNATFSPVRIPDTELLTVASHIGNHGPKTRIQRG